MNTILCWLVAICASLAVAAPVSANWAEVEPGHWYEVPNSDLSSHQPDPLPGGYHSAVISAWSGGLFDEERGLFIVWGGGHSDYAGNEIYAFDIETLTWTRLTEPTPESEIDRDVADPCVYLDGRPRAFHTYDYLEWVPTLGMCSVGGKGGYPSGMACNEMQCNGFDAQTGPLAGWYKPAIPMVSGQGFNYQSVNYDSSTNILYHSGKNSGGWQRIYALDLNVPSPVWELKSDGSDPPVSVGEVAAIEQTHQLLLIVGDSGQLYWDLNADGVWAPVDNYDGISGPRAVVEAKAPGLEWDEASGQLIAWVSGTSTFAYDFPSNSWRECPASSDNTVTPSSPQSNGTYGRFQYVPSKNAFVLYNRTSDNVFLYRLSSECTGLNVAPSSPTNLAVE